MSGPSAMIAANLWEECYAQCFHEKRHYDLLSWSIGAAMLAFTAFVIRLILDLPPDQMFVRIGYAFSVFPLFVIWVWIYERNRVWGEICNEVARDIERRFGIDGVQLRYMRAHIGKTVDRANSDLPEPLRAPSRQSRSRRIAPVQDACACHALRTFCPRLDRGHSSNDCGGRFAGRAATLRGERTVGGNTYAPNFRRQWLTSMADTQLKSPAPCAPNMPAAAPRAAPARRCLESARQRSTTPRG